MKKRLKVNGLLIFLATMAVFIFPNFFMRADSAHGLNDIAEVSGLALVVFGLLLRVSARGYKSELSEQGYALVGGGPYGLVRNPMYLGIGLIGLGIVVIMFKWWVGAIFILIFIARYIFLIFTEEKKLTLQFDEEYKKYTEATPRLFPGMKKLLLSDMRDILPIKLGWVRKDLGSIIGWILAIVIMELWRVFRA